MAEEKRIDFLNAPRRNVQDVYVYVDDGEFVQFETYIKVPVDCSLQSFKDLFTVQTKYNADHLHNFKVSTFKVSTFEEGTYEVDVDDVIPENVSHVSCSPIYYNVDVVYGGNTYKVISDAFQTVGGLAEIACDEIEIEGSIHLKQVNSLLY